MDMSWESASIVSVKGDIDTVTDFQVCESVSMWTKTNQGTYLYFQKAFVQLPH